jgi:hypothetical protein
MSAAAQANDKPAGAVEAPPRKPGAVVLDVFDEKDEAPGSASGGVFDPPPDRDRLRGLRDFLSITAVQQTLVLFLGSLAYDAGSVAYVWGPLLGCCCSVAC